MKARQLLAVLMREPLNYRIVRHDGTSHRHLEAEGRLPILFSFHDGATVPPFIARNFLVKQAGLTVAEALKLLKG
jgi:hypothetical protein